MIWTWGEGKPCKFWKTLWPLTGKLNSWTHYTDDIFRFNLVIFIWKMASYFSFIFIILLQISLSRDSYFGSCIFVNLILRNELIASYLFFFFFMVHESLEYIVPVQCWWLKNENLLLLDASFSKFHLQISNSLTLEMLSAKPKYCLNTKLSKQRGGMME